MSIKYGSPQEEALDLALSTRIRIIEGNIDILSVVRACFIVASNLSKKEDLKWIEGELNGHKENPEYREIKLPKKYKRGEFESTKLKFPITTFKYYKDANQSLTIVQPEGNLELRPDHCTEIIDFIINKCLNFLTECISEVHYLGYIQSIFEEIRKKVDSDIRKLGKEINQEMNSIYLNLISKNPADKLKVADSCRRILKFIANKVFPARENKYRLKSGIELEVKDNQFINRLICFFDEKEAKLTSSECHYLSNLNKEIEKGVHIKELSQEEASMIALHTYIILHESLRYI